MKKIRKISLVIGMIAALMLSFANVSYAMFSSASAFSVLDGGSVTVALDAQYDTEGWTVTATNLDTNTEVPVTPNYGISGQGKTKVDIKIPTNAAWHGIEIRDAAGELMQYAKVCYAQSYAQIDMMESYLQDINVYEGTVKVTPVEGENFTFTNASGTVKGVTGSYKCMDGTTAMGYYGTTSDYVTANYTVDVPSAGEYKVCFYHYYSSGINENSPASIKVNDGDAVEFGAKTSTGLFDLGTYSFNEGENIIELTKNTVTSKDRFYAGDVWLVPVTPVEESYAGLDICGIEFVSTVDGVEHRIHNITGDETRFKAIVIYNAVANGVTHTNEAINVVTALYDSDGKLIDVKLDERSVAPQGKQYTAKKRIGYTGIGRATTPMDLTQYEDVAKAKVFVWDNAGKLQPVCTNFDIEKAVTAE